MSTNVSKFLSACISFLLFCSIWSYLWVFINYSSDQYAQCPPSEPTATIHTERTAGKSPAKFKQPKDVCFRYYAPIFFPQRKKPPTTPKAPPDNQFNLNLVSWTITNAQSSADWYSVVSQYEHRLSVTTTETNKKILHMPSIGHRRI